jgi:enoyl-CoA hydratase
MAVEVKRDGAVAVVTVARPEVLNALNTATNEELLTVAREISHDAQVRAVVLTGAGDKAFVAGADIAEFRGMTPEDARQASWLGRKVIATIEGAPQPWIAAVNGFALGGGCELALACDIRFASETARFGQPEVGLGITPGFGGTQRLPREVGTGWASYLCLSGRTIDAAEAARIGLVQAVFPAARLMDEALKLAGELAAKPPLAVRYIKSQIHHALNVDIEAGHEIERDLFALTFASRDRLEGMDAFLEKREPKGFEGR